MFVTIRRYHAKGAMQEIATRVQKGLLPIVSKQPGFISYQAIDAGNNVAVSVSVYQDRASAEAANTQAAAWVHDNLAGLVGHVEVTMGDVIASSAQHT